MKKNGTKTGDLKKEVVSNVTKLNRAPLKSRNNGGKAKQEVKTTWLKKYTDGADKSDSAAKTGYISAFKGCECKTML